MLFFPFLLMGAYKKGKALIGIVHKNTTPIKVLPFKS
jgi:hypothetical protein